MRRARVILFPLRALLVVSRYTHDYLVLRLWLMTRRLLVALRRCRSGICWRLFASSHQCLLRARIERQLNLALGRGKHLLKLRASLGAAQVALRLALLALQPEVRSVAPLCRLVYGLEVGKLALSWLGVRQVSLLRRS